MEELVQRATEGDRAALRALIAAIQDDLYRLAFRMLGHPADAEDATQEILLRIVTHLGSFQGRSSFRTWAWRVATNHILNLKKGRREVFELETMSGLIAQAPAETPSTDPVLAEEVKYGCTEAMLLALDRDHRIAYVLGDLFELEHDEAAAVLEVEPATYRKRLQRARERIGGFMAKHCGLADERNACRCARMVPLTQRLGLLDPQQLIFKSHPTRHVVRRERYAAHVAEMDAMIVRAGEIQRSHPDYAAPDTIAARIRALIESSDWR